MSPYNFLTLFCVLLLLLLHSSGFTVGFNGPRKSGEAKCRERERQALLNFIQGLRDDSGMLSTWRDDENNRDCYKWKVIQCNNQTGHVQLLDLRSPNTHYLTGAVNLTSLIHLQNIEHLDLSNNYFLSSHIPELMGSFTNLRYLNLSYSVFGGRVPSKLGNLSQLRYLDLGRNSLHGAIPFQIGNLRQLQYLDLGSNTLSGDIPFQLGTLKQLQYLDLGPNMLSGVIPFQLGNLKQVQYLDLGGNMLSGAIPFQLGNLRQLQFLNLASNSLSGPIPFWNGTLPLLHTLRLQGNFDIKANDAEWLSNLYFLRILELISLHNLSSSFQWLQAISKHIPNLRELRLVDSSLSDTDSKSLFYSHSNSSTSLTILDLSSNVLISSTFQSLFNFSLNLQELYLSHNNIALLSSLYPNFPSLKILDLSYNNLTSSVFRGNFNFGCKLQELYLQNCILIDRSFLVLSASTMNSSSSLLYLDLSYNLLKSSAMFYWLFNFTTNLHTLYLSGNLLEGPIPDGSGKVMTLEFLSLYNNRLQGKIPSFFGNMCRLQSLDLSNNKLNGEISNFIQNSSWCNRHIIQSLDLSHNRITGKIPQSIRLLSELEELSLERNSLEGDITEYHLSNFPKLDELSLSFNSLSLNFVSSWVPPFRLSSLSLASCKLGATFPSWLQTQSSLTDLDISDNGLNDSVPEWFWNNLQHMYLLNMSHNNLTGAIPNIPWKLFDGPSVILNSNQFEGKVPSFLLQASELLLSQNKFSDLSSLLCDQSTAAKLSTLDLSNNQINGQLPDCWKSVEPLRILDLSNNNLSGEIPMSIGNLVYLEVLVLRNNNSLLGELPSTLKNCSNLIMLDVGENMLSGRIPSWVGESMQQLIILIMQGNNFSGNLPSQLCLLRHIQLLDLSRNKLSKGIPTCIKGFTAMSEKSINRTETRSRIYGVNMTYYEIYGLNGIGYYYELGITWMWKGAEWEFTDPEYILKSVDLSGNNLTGEIPKEVGYLLGLVSLNLSRNNLSGEIPSEIGNLSSLDSLDLSRNHLIGQIPSSLSEIDGLGKLNLSHNSLSGRIPSGRHFETYDASSFEGNVDLCGEQLNKTCPGDQTPVKPREPAVHGEDSVFYEALYMSMGLGYFVGFWGLIGPILIWQPWRIAYLRFLNRLTN